MKTGKKGFSFGEMITTLIIIGVISAVTIPVFTNSSSSNVKLLYKTAYRSVESVVNELINDVSLYPSGQFSDGPTFCANFFDKVNIIGAITNECDSDYTSTYPPATDAPNAVTTNGMKWYKVNDSFTTTCPGTSNNICLKVSVDVNGSGKGLNRETPDGQEDILHIYIYNTGRVTVPSGSTEEEYLTQ